MLEDPCDRSCLLLPTMASWLISSRTGGADYAAVATGEDGPQDVEMSSTGLQEKSTAKGAPVLEQVEVRKRNRAFALPQRDRITDLRHVCNE